MIPVTFRAAAAPHHPVTVVAEHVTHWQPIDPMNSSLGTALFIAGTVRVDVIEPPRDVDQALCNATAEVLVVEGDGCPVGHSLAL